MINNGKLYAHLILRARSLELGRPLNDCNQYKWIWKLKVAPKVRVFIWRIIWKSLPSAAWLARRDLADSYICPWGCPVAKTLCHALWDCPHAQEVWDTWHARTAIAVVSGDVCVSSGESFLQSFCGYGEAAGRRCSGDMMHMATIAITLYNIWVNRCARKHNEPTMSSALLIRKVRLDVSIAAKRHNEYASKLNENFSNSPELTVALHWVPSPAKWILINCDAAVGNDIAGVGIVIRDHLGKPLRIVGKRFISHACEAMDTLAILEALNVVKQSFSESPAVEIQ
ncbi:hypothetical protein HPP92_024373 [Vanilla planifolia]|uniref:Reverse transcriptase zinc-binding domain-containing protein n=1 Tax=Vanilla planifolia TaxID=51239 RepID=A0A835PQ63_VANPL|nr:hypothetical protein HPP92_024373 [Vanilla planifolia]